MELAQKRLETAILRLEALVNAVPAVGDTVAAPATAITAENDALREKIDAVHSENIALRESFEAMGGRLDTIIARLDEVVGGSQEKRSIPDDDAEDELTPFSDDIYGG